MCVFYSFVLNLSFYCYYCHAFQLYSLILYAFSKSQGVITCSTAISCIPVRNSGSELFFSSVNFHCRCTTVLKNRFVPGHFSISAPSIQFQTRKVFINLYHCTICFKHAYHWARALLGFIMHCFIIIMKFHPCNQL